MINDNSNNDNNNISFVNDGTLAISVSKLDTKKNNNNNNNNNTKNEEKENRLSCRQMELGIQHNLDVTFEEVMNNKRY